MAVSDGDMPVLLTPFEAGRILRVVPKTLTLWARQGLLTQIQLPSGHHRYREDEIRALAEGRKHEV